MATQPKVVRYDPVGSAAQTALYILVVLILIAVIVVFAVWLWTLSNTNSGKDVEARDICARDVHMSSNGFVGCDLAVGKDFQTVNAKLTGRLVIVPLRTADPVVTLTRQTSSVVLTSPSSSAVAVNLCQASNVLVGMYVLIVNQSGASTFTVTPANGDALNGVATPLTVSGTHVWLYMAGLNGNINAYNWVVV